MDSQGLWREADSHDDAFMRTLWARTHGEQFSVLPPELGARLCTQQYEAQLAHYEQSYPDMTVHVLRWKGLDAGRLMLLDRQDAVDVLDLAILPEHQGQGLGSRVLRRIKDHAGPRVVKLAVEKNRPRAQELYERLGFEAASDSNTHVFMEWQS